MKYLSLLLLLILSACQSKEDEPELDYVRIEVYPSLAGYPSEIQIDLKNKLLRFSSLQYLSVYEKECDTTYKYENIEELDFMHIDLNDEEIKILKFHFDDAFLTSIKKSNQEILDNPNKYQEILFDGTMYELDIIKNNQIFSTDNYLIVEKNDLDRISKVLNILKTHSKSKKNKKYIEDILRYLY